MHPLFNIEIDPRQRKKEKSSTIDRIDSLLPFFLSLRGHKSSWGRIVKQTSEEERPLDRLGQWRRPGVMRRERTERERGRERECAVMSIDESIRGFTSSVQSASIQNHLHGENAADIEWERKNAVRFCVCCVHILPDGFLLGSAFVTVIDAC